MSKEQENVQSLINSSGGNNGHGAVAPIMVSAASSIEHKAHMTGNQFMPDV